MGRKITILGGGQSGLQLACGLLQKGYDVTVVKTARPRTSAMARSCEANCMFDTALGTSATSGWISGRGMPDSQFHQLRGAGAGWLRQQGVDWNRLLDGPRRASTSAPNTRSGWTNWRSAAANSRSRGGGRRPGGLCDDLRPHHRCGRQRRHSQAVRARRGKVAVRQAAESVSVDLRSWHDAARGPFGRQLQSHSRRGRVFCLPRR